MTCAKASGPRLLREQAGCCAPLFSLSSAEALLSSCGFDPVPGMCRRQMELDFMVIPRACDMSMSCMHAPARTEMYEDHTKGLACLECLLYEASLTNHP